MGGENPGACLLDAVRIQIVGAIRVFVLDTTLKVWAALDLMVTDLEDLYNGWTSSSSDGRISRKRCGLEIVVRSVSDPLLSERCRGGSCKLRLAAPKLIK